MVTVLVLNLRKSKFKKLFKKNSDRYKSMHSYYLTHFASREFAARPQQLQESIERAQVE